MEAQEGDAEQIEAICGLEIVLAAFPRLFYKQANVTEAKDFLRKQFGDEGRKLASQISALSKARNAQAHPRAYRILAALEQLAQVATADEPPEPKAKQQDGNFDSGGEDSGLRGTGRRRHAGEAS